MTADAARRALDAKTKPPGSLGTLEAVAIRLAALQGTLRPRIDPARAVVFAADHGVTSERVSPYPSAVTAQMVRLFARGGAAVTVLARAAGCAVEVVDVGVDADLLDVQGDGGAEVVHAKVRCGTRNLAREPALTSGERDAAMAAGRAAARRAQADGIRTLLLGEMGIGNTTAAAALLSALTGHAPAETVGRGAGVDVAGLERKRAVVAKALERHAASADGGDVAAALASLGGLEIAALVGAILEGARLGLALVVDGFIVTVAALAAVRLEAAAAQGLFFAHRGAEAGHALALDACAAAGCEARPLLALDLRLGEASGAVAALPLLRPACALFEMATFAEADLSVRATAKGAAP